MFLTIALIVLLALAFSAFFTILSSIQEDLEKKNTEVVPCNNEDYKYCDHIYRNAH